MNQLSHTPHRIYSQARPILPLASTKALTDNLRWKGPSTAKDIIPGSLSIWIYIYIYVCMYAYIYIYIYLSLSIYLFVYNYMYIYIYIHMYIYIYIYIYVSLSLSLALSDLFCEPCLGPYKALPTLSPLFGFPFNPSTPEVDADTRSAVSCLV